MEVSQLKELKELQSENSKLKRMYAEQALQITMLKDVIGKKW
jgi:putative transposase